MVQLNPPGARTPLGTCFAFVDTLNLSEEQWEDAAHVAKVIEKLHVQFSHLPMSKLVPMLKSVRGCNV